MQVIDNTTLGIARNFKPISLEYVENGIRKMKGIMMGGIKMENDPKLGEVPTLGSVEEIAEWNEKLNQWEIPIPMPAIKKGRLTGKQPPQSIPKPKSTKPKIKVPKKGK